MDKLKNRFQGYQLRLRNRAVTVLWNLLLSWLLMELVGDVAPDAISHSKLLFWIAAALFPILVPAISVWSLWNPYMKDQVFLPHDELYDIWWESLSHISFSEAEAINYISAQEGFWRRRRAMLDTGVLKIRTLICYGSLLVGNILAIIWAYTVYHRIFSTVFYALPLTIWWICCKLREDYIIVSYILSSGVAEEE